MNPANKLIGAILISTPLQRGGTPQRGCTNRFNGLVLTAQTVQTLCVNYRRSSTPPKRRANERVKCRGVNGFTLLELLVILAVVCLLASLLIPAMARSPVASKTLQCQNNTRQLYSAWRQWADDHNDQLVAAEDLTPPPSSPPNWMTGDLNWDGANPSNFDTNVDIVRSPLWTYAGKSPLLFKCPADPSTVILASSWNGLPAGTIVPRVRSISMNSAFGHGSFLDKNFNEYQTVWRTYSKNAAIVLPANTFLFADEHAGSINDGQLYVACTGAQPGDPPSAAQIIDVPASYHNGAANFSFSDGHAQAHQWIGSKMRPQFQEATAVALNIPADDSWLDVQWLAQNTTVKR
jgi:prepilin-type processing-associated H-X9-DG protein